MQSMWLSAAEVRAMLAARRLTVERVLAEPPLAQDIAQLIASSPFHVGERYWVREDWCRWRAVGGVTHVAYRADGAVAGAEWRDAREMAQPLARLQVVVLSVSVAQHGGHYWWVVELRRVSISSARGHQLVATPQQEA